MKRGIVVLLCVAGAALASCKGAGGKKRVPDGEKASAAFLIRTIEAVRDVRENNGLLLLAQGVAEVCGKGCECLAVATGAREGNRATALYECPSVCTPDARARAIAAPAGEQLATLATACTPEVIGLGAESAKLVGYDWLAAFVSGQYFADAYDAANADDRKAYETALDGFVVPLAPTAAMAGVAVVGAENAGPVGSSRTFIVLDAKGAIRAGALHGARFTPKGAEYVPAMLQDFPDADTLGKKLREAQALGVPLASVPTGDDALAKAPPPSMDDPPPPPEDPDEDAEDDDASGGTGTAMALEEGKMGKKDSDRAEGQYKMKRNADDPQLARRQAIEDARAAGVLGQVDRAGGGAFASLTGTGDISSGFDDDSVGGLVGAPPPPEYSVVGLTDTLVRDQVLVFADGAAPAKKLLEVLSAIPDGAVVAIAHEGRAAALPLVFEGGAALLGNDLGDPDPDRVDLVVEVAADSYMVGATRANDLAKVNAGDTTGLRAALDTHFKSDDFGNRRDVKITVQDDAKVAQLVPALDAALGAGARAVRVQTPSPDRGFGPGGTGTGWGTIGTGAYGTIGGGQVGPRGTAPAGPSVSIGQPNAMGDLDKAIIRRYIKRNLPKITYCYEKQLLVKPTLEGTVTAKFFIMPSGSVGPSEASGVDPTVASCVAKVIKAIEFPKPKGGGGVQVNYPFTFRQAQPPAQK